MDGQVGGMCNCIPWSSTAAPPVGSTGWNWAVVQGELDLKVGRKERWGVGHVCLRTLEL